MTYGVAEEFEFEKPPYTFMHLDVYTGCGKPAFFFLVSVKDGDPISHNNVLWLDGRQSKADEQIICGSCGRGVAEMKAAFVVKTEEVVWDGS